MKKKMLNHLNEFFLNKTNIDKIINNCFILDEDRQERQEKINKNKIVEKKSCVSENDKLFWFWYIFVNGYEKYDFLGKNKYKIEMEIKTHLVEIIKKRKKELKKFKIKLNDVEQNLVYSKTISLNSLMLILYVNSINLVYFTDTVFYENNNNFNKTFIVYHDTKNDIFEMKNDLNIENIKEKKYIIQSLNKKIKAISSYKVPELKDICDKLSIKYMKTANKSFTKKEIYEKIIQKIS
jgi:hypothetical protein